MNRWDIINHLIRKNNYKSYLEIGYYKGWSFDNVNCEHKAAVDPNPCKSPEQELFTNGATPLVFHGGAKEEWLYKNTSNDFFTRVGEDRKWDIIFIDGLHEATQVTKDIENSLKHLSEGGTIVLHDCNPPKYEHTTVGIDGCWTGDTYAGVIKAVFNNQVEFYTIDTDWGVGIMRPGKMYLQVDDPEPTWDKFVVYRDEYLNLMSPEEFLKHERITDNNVPA